MIRRWPRPLSSLYARAIAVLVLAVLVSHALSMALYHFEFVERLTIPWHVSQQGTAHEAL